MPILYIVPSKNGFNLHLGSEIVDCFLSEALTSFLIVSLNPHGVDSKGAMMSHQKEYDLTYDSNRPTVYLYSSKS